jgi:hypothetical protein
MDWIDLAQDRDLWRPHVNALTKFWESGRLAASQKGLKPMELVSYSDG